MSRLKNKVAVVTGASKGIGASIAIHMAKEGAKVIVNYASDKNGAEKVVKTILDAGGSALAVQGDVSKETDVIRLFETVERDFGGLDILVNNAGVGQYQPIEAFTEESFQKQFSINVLGTMLSIREALKLLDSKGGAIINISSGFSKMPSPGMLTYSATKASIDAITVALSKELGAKHIRINSILPGGVETDGAKAAGVTKGSDAEKNLIAHTPLGRMGMPGDIAKVAVFLASDEAAWITGEQISVSGGIYGF
jgi:3-oxoacyl-[acyl-carrier protein] reductase